MEKQPIARALFLDVGGVLLTNGWGRESRRRAAQKFGLDFDEMNERHHLTYDTYEAGKLSLEAYLQRVVFYEPRRFSRSTFIAFMYTQSQPYPEMIELMPQLRKKYRLRIAVVSNEGRELTEYRIRKFNLAEFVDFFICSSFVHIRKPDEDLYRLALDVAQVPAAAVAYIEDRGMFVDVAQRLGIHGIHHVNSAGTKEKLASIGLVAP